MNYRAIWISDVHLGTKHAQVGKLLEFLIPLYRREGKSYLSVGLGCTGGRHRSPALARELRTRLAHAGLEVQVRDHDIAR